jgi:hypothetical protein
MKVYLKKFLSTADLHAQSLENQQQRSALKKRKSPSPTKDRSKSPSPAPVSPAGPKKKVNTSPLNLKNAKGKSFVSLKAVVRKKERNKREYSALIKKRNYATQSTKKPKAIGAI